MRTEYSKERFALDCAITAVLSALIYFVMPLFGVALAYWICLIFAAGIVFLGELLLSTGGDWDF